MASNMNNNYEQLSHDKEAQERQRQINNKQAWNDMHGYKTPSGCPCYDPTTNAMCIPKGRGYGYNLNLASKSAKILCIILLLLTIIGIALLIWQTSV